MAYKPQPIKTEGGQKQAVVADEDTQQLLKDILKELKKMNFQLMILTDNEKTNAEIE